MSAHVRLETLDCTDAEAADPDVRCRCCHCGAVLQRGTPLTLADFLETAAPFLARHATCRGASGGDS